jgi:CYTH domain-containing protein/predicted ATPase
MELHKIVITGGPSAGKTTGLSWIQNEFSKLGYTVLFVPETATEFISGGVTPWTCGTNLDYQKVQMTLQLEKERLFEQAARTMKADKILIVCDRGALDNKSYMNEEEFEEVLRYVGKTEVELRDSYDAVFHMVTAAKGAEQFYTRENNKARYETVEEAVRQDEKLIAAWTGHPHLRVIDNSVDFNHKLRRLIAEIRLALGEPEPLEIERKYLIAYPDVKWLESMPNCRRVEIVQYYLPAREGDELRIRKRGENGSYLYYKTLKRRISDYKRLEVEERLSEGEFLSLLQEADPDKRPVHKSRYCLTYEGQYFEIDLYPFWDDQAIVEIELSDENAEVNFPPELKVLREVTRDPAFRNSALAKLA